MELSQRVHREPTRRERILEFLKGDRVATQKEIVETLGIEHMSCGALLKEMVAREQLSKVPGHGPRGGAGYRTYVDPVAQLIKDIDKKEVQP